MPEYIAVRPFKYNSRMLAPGDSVVISRTFGRVFCAQRKVKPAPVPVPVDSEDELKAARAEYKDKLGKRPYSGWDVATLREKIAAA